MAGGSAEIEARIRRMRRQAGMRSDALAAKVGLSASALSRIEHGERSVKVGELVRIAEALRVSPLALLRDDDELVSRFSKATMATATTGAEGSEPTIVRRLRELLELDHLLSASDHAHRAKLKAIVPDFHASSWRTHSEQLGDWARGQLQKMTTTAAPSFKGPLDRLVYQVQMGLGIDVVIERHDADAALGAAITDWSFPLVLVNARHSVQRCLFTLGHELGHVLRNAQGPVVVDHDLDPTDEEERFANNFSAVLLMPKEDIDEVLGEEGGVGARALATMLLRFGVSLESLVYRLNSLGRINREGCGEIRRAGLHGLLRALRGRRATERDLRMGLLAMRTACPPASPPIGLVSRAGKAWDAGVISIRPLAGLLGEDPDALLRSFERADEGVIDADYSEPDASREECFTSSPI